MVKVIYVYNEHDAAQIALIERVKEELGNYLVEIVGSQDAKDRFHISNLPALIPVCEHLQGEHLLDENGDGKLRIVGEVWKWIEEAEKHIHDVETNRIDHIINAEVQRRLDALAAAPKEKTKTKTT